MANDFFPPRPASHPMIYAYTEKEVERHMVQQYLTKRPDGRVPYLIVLTETAKRTDSTCLTGHDAHQVLRQKRVSGVCSG